MENSPDTKTIVVGIAVLAIILSAVFIGYSFFDGSLRRSPKHEPVYTMRGVVRGVDGNVVTIEGSFGNGTTTREFIVTPQTALVREGAIITREQLLKRGVPFTPGIEVVSGKLEDLKPGVRVDNARSDKNLLEESRVEAVELKYGILEIQNMR